jgi:hypothetical protein
VLVDVAFGEDAFRKRKGNVVNNYSLPLKRALNFFKNKKTEKQGIKGKRLKVAWEVEYLKKVIKIEV